MLQIKTLEKDYTGKNRGFLAVYERMKRSNRLKIDKSAAEDKSEWLHFPQAFVWVKTQKECEGYKGNANK